MSFAIKKQKSNWIPPDTLDTLLPQITHTSLKLHTQNSSTLIQQPQITQMSPAQPYQTVLHVPLDAPSTTPLIRWPVNREEESLHHVAMVATLLDDNKLKTSLTKWIRTASNFIDLIQFHLIWQMLAKFSKSFILKIDMAMSIFLNICICAGLLLLSPAKQSCQD